MPTEKETLFRLLDAARTWQTLRDQISAIEADHADFDQVARDTNDAEAALALAIRLHERTKPQNGAKK